MKLTNLDKVVLLGWGHPEEDFSQIEEAMQKRKTKYKLGSEEISRERAISLLGRTKYLAGIARSAFHFTSAQKTEDGRVVYFDSSQLFK